MVSSSEKYFEELPETGITDATKPLKLIIEKYCKALPDATQEEFEKDILAVSGNDKDYTVNERKAMSRVFNDFKESQKENPNIAKEVLDKRVDKSMKSSFLTKVLSKLPDFIANKFEIVKEAKEIEKAKSDQEKFKVAEANEIKTKQNNTSKQRWYQLVGQFCRFAKDKNLLVKLQVNLFSS